MHKKPSNKFTQRIAELTEALQRERADAVNIRRRHEEQIANLNTVVKTEVVSDLLPVIDNFERALKHTPKNLKNNDYIKGVNAIVKQFEKTLEQIGLERIKTIGKHFNPELHEAISMEEVSLDSEGNDEVVSEELQSGYVLGDNVIRHAMVRVRMQSPPKPSGEGGESAQQKATSKKQDGGQAK